MKQSFLNLSRQCNLQSVVFEADPPYFHGAENLYLNYIENSPDAWYSDHETSLDISKDEGLAMVKFILEHFNIYKAEKVGDEWQLT